ncbi:hypothetical protein DRE_06574 [Drechslerella stenobrocha 248]|uniref:Uncharacterized protein n=1 Tax=Drechslerella stenobrocha 248 TaxID=1043628 RepID=W7HXN6_9PEZI|nr:hypothetical protein DRE_06574 [Drechslerella stenobrocha 248]
MDIHRCRFVDFVPAQIHALAFSHPSPHNPQSHPLPPSLRLAIGRSNGSIEIWNPTTWFHESTLHGGQNRSIEGLAWVRQQHYSVKHTELLRLFSIGNSTVVTEWDLVTGRPLAHFDCGKGIIWSIAAQPRNSHFDRTASAKPQLSNDDNSDDGEPADEGGNHLTVGCEDGSLVVIAVGDSPGELSLAKIIPQSKPCRVLSLAYQSPTVVVAGTSDSRLRAFDLTTGRILATMSVAPKFNSKRRNAKKRDTYVWTVRCLPSPDNASGGWIVAGDSLGEISVYDGKRYALRQKLKAHEADVLTLETNAAGTQLFSSGVDRVTVKHALVGAGTRRAVWTEVARKRFHRHDVRAMAGFEAGPFSVLVSGGVDMTSVVVPLRRFAEEYQYTLSALPQYQVCATNTSTLDSTAASSRLLVARFDREVKIWRISTIDEVEAADDVELYGAADDEQGRKLVGQIMVNTDENISSAAISPAGDLLAISTMATIKLFHLRPRKPTTTQLRISKLELPDKIASIGARQVLFSPDGKTLAVIAPNSEPYLFRITSTAGDDGKPSFEFSPPRHLDRKDREPATNGGNAKLSRKDGVIALGRGYERQISHACFSPHGRYLFAADVGGWMEAWTCDDAARKPWRLLKTSLPRLPASPAAIAFRPVQRGVGAQAADSAEVFVMTAEHTLHEFDVNTGLVTAWSARNSARLPRAFLKLKDRCFGMAGVQEAAKGRRMWCFGHGWVYMFSVDRDLPALRAKEGDTAVSAGGMKRKRTGVVMTTGAGGEALHGRKDMVKRTEVTLVGRDVQDDDDDDNEDGEENVVALEDVDSDEEFLVDKVRNDVRQRGGAVEIIRSDSEDSSDDDDASSNSDAESDSDNESALSTSDHADADSDGGVKLPADTDTDTGIEKMDVDSGSGNSNSTALIPFSAKAAGVPYWHTFEYRNVMAFLPIGDPQQDVEIVVVERPVADVKLPPAWVPRRGNPHAQKFV